MGEFTEVSSPEAGSQQFEIRPLPGTGAEIIGLDLSHKLNTADFRRIHQAHLHYHLLVFRQQTLTPEQQIAFSRRFGPLQIHVLKQFLLDGYPEILIVSNIVRDGKPVGLGDAGKYWHSDLSYKQIPSLGSMLYGKILPAVGGDTRFANMHKAWETLPEKLRRKIEGLRAVHSYTATYSKPRFGSQWRPVLTEKQLSEVKAVSHPVIRTHPETGHKALFVSEGFTTHIEGLAEDESRDILQALYEHSIREENIYTHCWQAGDLLFWDNRSLIHLATGCPEDCPRQLYRTTIEGDIPF
ncbi:TauD/TfdA family dioxygenase [Tatumella sp. JGM130]|uniref:TauD/TfdA dioxygenase family protein n=1 Tax=Tatumella sp. JGM130 TaxID=2799797 RepID=UPI001BB0202F|nr:TauD/TfdA family dioxygenase [Tatumella sp. JGM130]MBS0895037.1 TauD/TfdA family dioxygenase [Tatumella sp. JGM130]